MALRVKCRAASPSLFTLEVNGTAVSVDISEEADGALVGRIEPARFVHSVLLRHAEDAALHVEQLVVRYRTQADQLYEVEMNDVEVPSGTSLNLWYPPPPPSFVV